MLPTKQARALIVAAAVLAVLLTPALVLAAPSPQATVSTPAATSWSLPLEQMGQWASRIVDGLVAGPVAVWQKVGCGADPSGALCPSTAPPAAAVDLHPVCDPGSGSECRRVPAR